MDLAEQIREKKVIAILRGVPGDQIVDVARALADGGVELLEITFDQSSPSRILDTSAAIAAVKAKLGDRLTIGAGTVMSVEEVHAAKKAGASFILAPNVDEAVIRESVACGMGAVPGALSPSEIADAYRYGASVVKLFPAGTMGLDYCKAVMAPINHIPMIAVGGVDDRNLPDFLKLGFIGAGIGSSLTNRKLIAEHNYSALMEMTERYLAAANQTISGA